MGRGARKVREEKGSVAGVSAREVEEEREREKRRGEATGEKTRGNEKGGKEKGASGWWVVTAGGARGRKGSCAEVEEEYINL